MACAFLRPVTKISVLSVIVLPVIGSGHCEGSDEFDTPVAGPTFRRLTCVILGSWRRLAATIVSLDRIENDIGLRIPSQILEVRLYAGFDTEMVGHGLHHGEQTSGFTLVQQADLQVQFGPF